MKFKTYVYAAILRKACECVGPSSGPRIVGKPSKTPEGSLNRVTMRIASVACDLCDAPWKADKTWRSKP